MSARPRPEGARTLKQAAATLFSLLALLPLLIFLWTLYRLDVLEEPAAQIGLGLSLGLSVLGFVVLRRLMGQISNAMQALAATAARAAHSPAPGAAPSAVALRGKPAEEADASGRLPEPANARTVPGRDGGAATVRAPLDRSALDRARPAAATPGLGTIRELADMTTAVSALWRREAEMHVGGIVKVDVINSTSPVVGTLVQVTDDGLLLEHDGEQFGVVWRRIAAVERSARPSTA